MATDKRAFISIVRADMKPVTAELRRLADCFELYLQLTHGYSVRPAVPLTPGSSEKESMDFFTDFEAKKQEILDLIKGRPQAAVDEPSVDVAPAEEGDRD